MKPWTIIAKMLQNWKENFEKIRYTFHTFLSPCELLYKYCCTIAAMDSTNVEFHKSNRKTEIMDVQQYCLRVAYLLINLEGIFT